jgi:hypothetical protein
MTTTPSTIPGEYDLSFEAERTRWIQRRFLWMCGILIVVGLLQLPSARADGGRHPGRRDLPAAGVTSPTRAARCARSRAHSPPR